MSDLQPQEMIKLADIADAFGNAVEEGASEEQIAAVQAATTEQDQEDLAAIAEEIAGEVMAGGLAAILAGDKAEELQEELKGKIAPKVLELSNIFAEVAVRGISEDELVGFMPAELIDETTVENLQKAGANNLAWLAARAKP